MKTEKETPDQEFKLDWSKINIEGPGYEEKMARANEALKGANLPELVAEARAARKQQD